MTRAIDTCRARGCGGYLRGVDANDVRDGEIAECVSCGREHTFHVAEDGAVPDVTIARKPRRGR